MKVNLNISAIAFAEMFLKIARTSYEYIAKNSHSNLEFMFLHLET